MNRTTRIYLETLTEASATQVNIYFDNLSETELIDAYGNSHLKSELYMLRGYLLPRSSLDFTRNQSFTKTEMEDIRTKGVIQFINVDDPDYPCFRHISSFVLCVATNKYYPDSQCYSLNEAYYEEDENGNAQRAYSDFCCEDIHGNYILSADAVELHGHYQNIHEDADDITFSEHYCEYVLDSEGCYPEDDPDTIYHNDDVHWVDGCAWVDKDAAFENRIRDYHATPDPDYFLKDDETNILSKFTIGFEVEKSSIDGYSDMGSEHEEQPLFKGWETDSSCGVEGITNVYSMNNYELFKQHAKASYYLDEETSQRCGGHINICDTTNTIKYWHIKSWCGLWWSMYRKRLRNDYAGNNKKACPYAAKSGARYSAIREKQLTGNKMLYELRLPSRVKNTQQIIRRFELSQAWVKCLYAYATEDWSYTQASYDDKSYGIPNWAVNEATNGRYYADECAKVIAQIPKQIVNRIRFLVEESKPQLIESYPVHSDLCKVIRLAYVFQYYCELPDYTMPEFVRQELSHFL
jgi:hypothetical protein